MSSSFHASTPRTPIGWFCQGLVLVDKAVRDLVKNLHEGDCVFIADFVGSQFEGNQRDGAIEELNNIQKSGSYFFGNDDSGMLVLGIALSFNVPILDCADDVAFVGGAQLNFNLVSFERFLVIKKKVEASRVWLHPLLVFECKVTQAEDRGIICDLILSPFFIQTIRTLKAD